MSNILARFLQAAPETIMSTHHLCGICRLPMEYVVMGCKSRRRFENFGSVVRIPWAWRARTRDMVFPASHASGCPTVPVPSSMIQLLYSVL